MFRYTFIWRRKSSEVEVDVLGETLPDAIVRAKDCVGITRDSDAGSITLVQVWELNRPDEIFTQ